MIFATKETRSALFLVATLAAFLLVHSVAVGDEPKSKKSDSGEPAPAEQGKPAERDPAETAKNAQALLDKFSNHEATVKQLRREFGSDPKEIISKLGLPPSVFKVVTDKNGESNFQIDSKAFDALPAAEKERTKTMMKTIVEDKAFFTVFNNEQSKKGCLFCAVAGEPNNLKLFGINAGKDSGSKVASGCTSCTQGNDGDSGSCPTCPKAGGDKGDGGGGGGGGGGQGNGGMSQMPPQMMPPLQQQSGAGGGSGGGSGGGGSGSSSGGDSKGGSVATIAGPGKVAGSPETTRPKEAAPVFVSTRKKEKSKEASSGASMLPDSIVAAVIPKIEEKPKASEVTERKVASTGGETLEGPQAQVPSAVATNASAPSAESAKAFANSFDTSEARSGHGLTRDSE